MRGNLWLGFRQYLSNIGSAVKAQLSDGWEAETNWVNGFNDQSLNGEQGLMIFMNELDGFRLHRFLGFHDLRKKYTGTEWSMGFTSLVSR